jgi:hypothetical protein
MATLSTDAAKIFGFAELDPETLHDIFPPSDTNTITVVIHGGTHRKRLDMARCVKTFNQYWPDVKVIVRKTKP